MDADEREWVERGLYDPRAPEAVDRLATLRYLASHGATDDDLAGAVAAGTLPVLAGELVGRRRRRITTREAAERAGIPVELAQRIRRTSGLGEPGLDDAVCFDEDIATFRLFEAAAAIFGVESAMQWARVAGAALANIADAAMTNFGQAAALADFGQPRHVRPDRRVLGPCGLDWSRRGLSAAELGAVICDFEQEATQLVSATDGRVVKMIGDEVMFVTTDARAACAQALELADWVERHAVLGRLRVGLAAGNLARGGDYYGPIVNTAARAAKLADPGSILVTASVRDRAVGLGLSFESAGEHMLRGFDTSVALFQLKRA